MSSAPVMDRDEVSTFKRRRFLDVDGRGIAHMIFLPHGGALICLNRCGNSWSESVAVPQFPKIKLLSILFTLDILGKGTSYLCWTGPDAEVRMGQSFTT